MKIKEKFTKKQYLPAVVFQENDTEESFFLKVDRILKENYSILEHNLKVNDRILLLKATCAILFYIIFLLIAIYEK